MSLPLDLRFTDPAAPLFIDLEGDNSETLFVISTSLVHETDSNNQNRQDAALKRKREQEDRMKVGKPQKPMKAAQRADAVAVARAQSSVRDFASRSQTWAPGSMPPPTFIPPLPSQNGSQRPRDPLFLPGSQNSVANEEALRASGLGIENMDVDELADMLEGDGEEVGLGSQKPAAVARSNGGFGRPEEEEDMCGAGDSFELMEETEMIPTQAWNTEIRSKVSYPTHPGQIQSFTQNLSCRCSDPCSKINMQCENLFVPLIIPASNDTISFSQRLSLLPYHRCLEVTHRTP